METEILCQCSQEHATQAVSQMNQPHIVAHTLKIYNSVACSPQANYTDRTAAAC
jgi:hypothetical protein